MFHKENNRIKTFSSVFRHLFPSIAIQLPLTLIAILLKYFSPLSSCHPFSSNLPPAPVCQLPVLAVWAEVSGPGRAQRRISVSACLCNSRRRASGLLSADQHWCRWEVKSSLAMRREGWATLTFFSPLSPSFTCLNTLSFYTPFFSFVISVVRIEWALTKYRDW